MGQYDIISIGANFGGLAAAALLGKKGRKSFVCTPHASLQDALGRIQREGYSFSRGPALSYGFEQGGEFQWLFSELNITDINPNHADGYQVALPDKRITVYGELDATLEEIQREFPSEIMKAANFYRDIKKETMQVSKSSVSAFISRFKSARSFISKYHFSKEFLAFLEIQALYFFQKSITALSIKDLFTLCTHQPFRNDNGYEKIADRLATGIVRQGGTIQFNESSTEILFRNNRSMGIKAAHDTIEATTVLLDISEISRPALLLGIHDQVVPVGMGRDVLYLPDYSQPYNYLSLSLSAKDDNAAAPKDMRTLTATFPASVNLLPAGRDLLIHLLTSLMPFLNDFLKVTIMPTSPMNATVPEGILFKPLRCGKGEPHLFRGPKRNVYEFREFQDAPLEMMPAIRKLIKQIA